MDTETYSKYEIDNLIIVGGESSKQKYPGPTVNESLEKISRDNRRRENSILCGGICIPSRRKNLKT